MTVKYFVAKYWIDKTKTTKTFRLPNLYVIRVRFIFMFSPKRLLNTVIFSSKGFKSAWHTEAAFRDIVALIIITQAFCLYVQPDLILWLLFAICNAILVIGELLNTGLEYICDHISMEQHPLLGQAKDVGSAATMTSLFINGLVLVTIVWRALNHA